MSIISNIKALLLRRFYYNKSGCPLKCERCKSTEFEEVVRDDINGIVSEYIIYCKDCGLDVGYWGYGYYDPRYRANIFTRDG